MRERREGFVFVCWVVCIISGWLTCMSVYSVCTLVFLLLENDLIVANDELGAYYFL